MSPSSTLRLHSFLLAATDSSLNRAAHFIAISRQAHGGHSSLLTSLSSVSMAATPSADLRCQYHHRFMQRFAVAPRPAPGCDDHPSIRPRCPPFDSTSAPTSTAPAVAQLRSTLHQSSRHQASCPIAPGWRSLLSLLRVLPFSHPLLSSPLVNPNMTLYRSVHHSVCRTTIQREQLQPLAIIWCIHRRTECLSSTLKCQSDRQSICSLICGPGWCFIGSTKCFSSKGASVSSALFHLLPLQASRCVGQVAFCRRLLLLRVLCQVQDLHFSSTIGNFPSSPSVTPTATPSTAPSITPSAAPSSLRAALFIPIYSFSEHFSLNRPTLDTFNCTFGLSSRQLHR
eukprot:gene38132-47066_t